MKNRIIFLLSLLVFTSLIVLVYASAQAQSLELKIYKGWNLVSLAVMSGGPEDFKITCPLQDLIVLYGYDPLEKRYVKIKDVTEADPDRGIFHSAWEFYKGDGTYQNYIARSSVNSGWLYSTKDCTITIPALPPTFTLKDSLSVTSDRVFPAGWNFFTVFSDMVGKNFDEIKGDCIREKSYAWNPETQIWWELKNQPFPETVVGYGIIFKTTNDCLLGKVTIPEVPELPE